MRQMGLACQAVAILALLWPAQGNAQAGAACGSADTTLMYSKADLHAR